MLIGSVLEGEKKNCKAMYETLQLLKNPPKKYLQEKVLLTRIIRLELTASDLKREHAIQYNARKIKRNNEEKRRQSLLNNRRQDPVNRSIREQKGSEKTASDKSQQQVNGHNSSSPDTNGRNVYTSYTKEPTSGNRGHRRTSSEVRSVTMRGEWVENEVRNRRTKRTGSDSRGNSR